MHAIGTRSRIRRKLLTVKVPKSPGESTWMIQKIGEYKWSKSDRRSNNVWSKSDKRRTRLILREAAARVAAVSGTVGINLQAVIIDIVATIASEDLRNMVRTVNINGLSSDSESKIRFGRPFTALLKSTTRGDDSSSKKVKTILCVSCGTTAGSQQGDIGKNGEDQRADLASKQAHILVTTIVRSFSFDSELTEIRAKAGVVTCSW